MMDSVTLLHRVANDFRAHSPKGSAVSQMDAMRNSCKELGAQIVNAVPAGREQATALTKLEEVMFWANAGIARNARNQEENN